MIKPEFFSGLTAERCAPHDTVSWLSLDQCIMCQYDASMADALLVQQQVRFFPRERNQRAKLLEEKQRRDITTCPRGDK